ncbi:hypothetical protein [Cupriavidus respiraculi]|nr:hypothetical protein [Cupriavidus respiraculi]
MDQVTRKRMHNGLITQFDRAVSNIEATTLMPARAMHPVGMVRINGEVYRVQVVLEMPRADGNYEPDTAA